MDILNIKAPILKDDSINEYEYHEYLPITGTNLNNSGGNIRIDIETQDIFYHPSESYLQILGVLEKTNGTPYTVFGADSDEVSLTNNGLMYLFKNIRYQLSGQEIESINYPGQATTMLGLLKYPDDFAKSQGLNQLWYKDTDSTASSTDNSGFAVRRLYTLNSNTVGVFSVRIPLKHIFGFCEDYNKVLYGMKQTLTLTRNDDNDAIFKAPLVAAGGGNPARHEPGRVRLQKVSLFMPHVEPEDGNKLELYKFIEKKEKFPVGYRMIQSDSISVPQATGFTWRLSAKSSPEVPRFLIVAFQENRSGNQERNSAIFDNINVKGIHVMLGSKKYPAYDYDINFNQNQFSRIYSEAALFRKKFFNMDELVSNPNITPSDYKDLFPLFVIDLSKQSERLKYSVTDIHIKVIFTANPNPNTEAFAVLLSDRLINFQSDGNKMSVVY